VHDVFGMPYTFGRMFWPTDQETAHALDTKAKLPGGPKRAVIGWCITGTRPDKIYYLAALAISRLIKELNVHVVLLGAPPPYRDYELAKQIVEHVEHANGSTAGVHLAMSPKPYDPENKIPQAQWDTWPLRRVLTSRRSG
jgi:hypothetical protein